jgi:lysophospholipase L1-like esterase
LTRDVVQISHYNDQLIIRDSVMALSRRVVCLSGLATGVATGLATGLFPSISSAASRQLSAVPAIDPRLSYEGRTFVTPQGNVQVGWPGVALHIKATASRIALKTIANGDEIYVDVVVNGEPPHKVLLARGQQDLVVYDGAMGQQNIQIVARGEVFQGIWEIVSIDVGQGRLLPTSLPSKKLMFIGDSITAGSANDVSRTDLTTGPSIANANGTYGRILGRRLGAQTHLVAKSGAGLYRDWRGAFGETVPEVYERAIVNDADKLWSPAAYIPDAIGICLGTNDFNQGFPEQAIYIAAYVAFLQKIRRDAPNAKIILVESPMMSDEPMPRRIVLTAYLKETIRRMRDVNIWHAPIKQYRGRPTDTHPIIEDNEAIATEVEPLFRKALFG